VKIRPAFPPSLCSLCLCVSAFAFLILPGCARIPSGVHVVSNKGQQRFDEKYPSAYISRGQGGDYHVVLLKDGTSKWNVPKPGDPIPPLELADVRQIMHVHILWQPLRGNKPDNPSATNAAIDWYLVRAGVDGTVTGLVHYEGAGLVTTSLADEDAGIIIRSAALSPKRVEGDITDPVGPLRMTARFDAVHFPSAVDDVLAQLERLKTGGVTGNVDAARLTQPAAAARVP
jgi:hypothetical protein